MTAAACGGDNGDHHPLPAGWAPAGGAAATPAGPTPAAPRGPVPPPQPSAAGVTRSVSSSGASTSNAAGQIAVDPGKEAVLADVRKRPFKNEDFIEGETNRDPFHSFLEEFSAAQTTTAQYKILMGKYSLDELKLVTIVSPPTTAYRGGSAEPAGGSAYRRSGAMFRDPSGVGEWVERGDHMSRADAKVTRIASDRIYLEMREDLGGGKSRVAERVIELHAGEPTQEGP